MFHNIDPLGWRYAAAELQALHLSLSSVSNDTRLQTMLWQWITCLGKGLTSWLSFMGTSDYHWLRLVVLGFGVYQLIMTPVYWFKARKARQRPYIASLSATGKIFQELGNHEIVLLLRDHLSDITQLFQETTQRRGVLPESLVTEKEFEEMLQQVDATLKLSPEAQPLGHEVAEDLVVKTGAWEVPVGAIGRLLGRLPVFFRSRYRASLLHVSIACLGQCTQMMVYTERRRGSSLRATAKRPETLEEVSDLVRNIAFMILELHDRALPGWHWRGMLHFADGLKRLSAYRNSANRDDLEGARSSFALLADADPDNHEALYFVASMLVAERTESSINTAISYLHSAERTDNKQRRAFVHASLAHAYAQQVHRLGKREGDTLQKAQEHAEKAQKLWQQFPWKRLHPQILYVLSFVEIAGEGAGESDDRRNRRFVRAATNLLRALKREPGNWMFWNTLGWTMLKLAEWGVDDLKEWGGSKKLGGNPADRAANYFQESLRLCENKLSHANLCLLYATPHYRRQEDHEKYLRLCYEHGGRAIKLDPNYVNGHRDLAFSLLRYGKFNEGLQFFKKSIALAPSPGKCKDLKADVKTVFSDLGKSVNDKIKEAWLCAEGDGGAVGSFSHIKS